MINREEQLLAISARKEGASINEIVEALNCAGAASGRACEHGQQRRTRAGRAARIFIEEGLLAVLVGAEGDAPGPVALTAVGSRSRNDVHQR